MLNNIKNMCLKNKYIGEQYNEIIINWLYCIAYCSIIITLCYARITITIVSYIHFPINKLKCICYLHHKIISIINLFLVLVST